MMELLAATVTATTKVRILQVLPQCSSGHMRQWLDLLHAARVTAIPAPRARSSRWNIGVNWQNCYTPTNWRPLVY